MSIIVVSQRALLAIWLYEMTPRKLVYMHIDLAAILNT